MPKQTELREEFNKRFELESEGCSECGGFELVDLNETRYPKGKYHCEYDLDKIADWWLEKRDQELAELEKELDGMYLGFNQPSKFHNRQQDGAYNHALADILVKLKEKRGLLDKSN
jgi:hypothetical protein